MAFYLWSTLNSWCPRKVMDKMWERQASWARREAIKIHRSRRVVSHSERTSTSSIKPTISNSKSNWRSKILAILLRRATWGHRTPTQSSWRNKWSWRWRQPQCISRPIRWMGSVLAPERAGHIVGRRVMEGADSWPMKRSLRPTRSKLKTIMQTTNPTTRGKCRGASCSLNMGLRRRFKVRPLRPNLPLASQARPSKMALLTAAKLQPRLALSRKAQVISHPSSSRGTEQHS